MGFLGFESKSERLRRREREKLEAAKAAAPSLAGEIFGIGNNAYVKEMRRGRQEARAANKDARLKFRKSKERQRREFEMDMEKRVNEIFVKYGFRDGAKMFRELSRDDVEKKGDRRLEIAYEYAEKFDRERRRDKERADRREEQDLRRQERERYRQPIKEIAEMRKSLRSGSGSSGGGSRAGIASPSRFTTGL